MKLFIKNMVTIRCKLIVKSVLENLGLRYNQVDLGQVDLKEDISVIQREQLRTALLNYGLVLLEDRKAILIEKIKSVVVEMVHYEDELPKIKNSDYISEKLHYDYTYLANLFSDVTGITIEHYIIMHKIERVKELLVYDELSLKEIAWKLHYSSVAHLSNQFRKITGLTPTFFKHLKDKRLTALENVGIVEPSATYIMYPYHSKGLAVQVNGENLKFKQNGTIYARQTATGS
jgi:AraC-like DNA-binding protein